MRLFYILGLLLFIISCGANDNGKPNPEISTIQPNSGPPGTMVTIAGSGFHPENTGNEVRFNGTVATISVAKEPELKVLVPEEATSGRVSVTVGESTANGSDFTVEALAPGISSLEPDSGIIGSEVTIKGMNFSSKASDNKISFNGIPAVVSSATETELVTEVPDGATDGPVKVTVSQKTTTGPNFDVITEGALKVVSVTSGTDVDNDGYKISLNQNHNYTLNSNGEIIVGSLSAGNYAAELINIAGNCFVAGDNPITLSITAGDTTTTTYNIDCQEVLKNRIVFRSNPDAPNGDYDIYSINTEGSDQQKLFDNQERVSFPKLSNGGSRIVFRRDDVYDLFIANIDGKELQRITDLPDYAFPASWSPDDSRLVFSNGTEDDAELYVVNADGTELTQITDDGASNGSPDWSPDGSKIVFVSDIDGDFDIYVMDANGQNVQQITTDSHNNYAAKWSPDGSEFIFSSDRDDFFGEIYRMNTDGSNIRRITTNGGSSPDWSPDGLEIVFNKTRNIHKINSDGSGTSIHLTNNPNTNDNFIGVPDWSPLKD